MSGAAIRLPAPPDRYDPRDQRELRRLIETFLQGIQGFASAGTGGGGGVTLPIAESDVTDLVADLAARPTQAQADLLYSALGHTHAASDIVSGAVALARGGTGVDLSASGGTTKILAQDASHVISARDLVAADIPNLDAAKITTGVFAIGRLASGTPDGTKFVRDDGTLAVPSGSLSGSGTTGKIAKWSGSGALTDSIITEATNLLTAAGDFKMSRVSAYPVLTFDRTTTSALTKKIELTSTGLSTDSDWTVVGQIITQGTNASLALNNTTAAVTSTISMNAGGTVVHANGRTYLQIQRNAAMFLGNSSDKINVVNDILFSNDATNDIGASGSSRPRDIYNSRWHIINGGLQFAGVLTPAQITSDQNDYEPSGFLTSSMVRISSDTTRNITGFGRDAAAHVKLLMNVGGFNITLKHESASSTANKRIACPNATDITWRAGSAIFIAYDPTADRWRVVALYP